MYAVEFQTRVTNGVIEIPDELKGKLAGAVRVIVLTEEEPAEAEMPESSSPLEKEYILANQTAAERGAMLWREASLHQAEISAAAAAAFAEMGISGAPVGPEKLREMMLADGVNPEDNQFSRGIIEMREE
jgi:hypothetical protein